MDINNLAQTLSIILLPLILGITLHEAAHGYVAYKLGDNTAKILGRLTLNPIPHIDLIGTVVIPIATFMFSGFIFGYAKPVPINSRKLKKINRDYALIALAGPLANLFMALIWACLFKAYTLYFNQPTPSNYAYFFIAMAYYGILINLILMIINLIPIPPLDGSKVLAYYLPNKIRYYYNLAEPWGILVLLVFLLIGGFQYLILPLILQLQTFFTFLFQLNY